MKLLLHTCCAVCLIYPLERLRGSGFDVEAFFYNPNIHPLNEYSARRQAVAQYADKARVAVTYPDYAPQEFFREVNLKEDSTRRCPLCWALRLGSAARYAKERGFTHFSTTLLVSPYQDQGQLKKIGTEAAVKEGLDFYYEDFRPGFREAHDKARASGIYCQKYCGCIYSEIERYKSKK